MAAVEVSVDAENGAPAGFSERWPAAAYRSRGRVRVRIDAAVVSDKGLKLAAGTYVVQVGKRKFARVTLS